MMNTARSYTLMTLLIAFGVLVAVLYLQSISQDPEKIVWDLKKSWAEQSHKLDYVIIGSSRSLALDPSVIEKNTKLTGLNFSAGGAQLPYVYYQLQRLIKHSTIKHVYIELVPAQLTTSEYSLKMAFGERFIRYYADDEIIAELSQVFPEVTHFYRELSFIQRNSYPLTYMYDKLKVWHQGLGTDYIEGWIKTHHGAYIFGPPAFPMEQRTFAFDVPKNLRSFDNPISPVSEFYFDRLLELLEAKQIATTFFFSPISEDRVASLQQTDHEYFNTQKLIFKMQQKGLQGQIVYPSKWFSDGFHLNYPGSLKFSEDFAECVINKVCEKVNMLSIESLTSNQ